MENVIILKTEYFANTYLLTNDKCALIIDPACDLGVMQAALGDLEVAGVFLTHGHYDHFRSLNAVLSAYNVTCYLHEAAYQKLGNPQGSYAIYFGEERNQQFDRSRAYFLKDAEVIRVDGFTIEVLLTPGHTNCSVCLLHKNLIFTGDTLFKGTIGRTDLVTGNSQAILKSLQKVACREGDWLIYPGHDQMTTLEQEAARNPFLKSLKSKRRD